MNGESVGTLLLNLQRKARVLAAKGGAAPASVPSLTAYRVFGTETHMPQGNGICVFIIVGGTLRLHSPSGVADYPPGSRVVCQVDTPPTGIVHCLSDQGDFLAFSIRFETSDTLSTLLELDSDVIRLVAGGELAAERMVLENAALLEDLTRLLDLRTRVTATEYMQKCIMREAICHILCGTSGRLFLRVAASTASVSEVYEANSWIKENFRDSFTVQELAEQASMSTSAFHLKFKRAVGMGPLQCQKRLRLAEARRLMLEEGRNVTEAAVEVGYESVSQFARDYRNVFAAAPKTDIANLRCWLEDQASCQEE